MLQPLRYTFSQRGDTELNALGSWCLVGWQNDENSPSSSAECCDRYTTHSAGTAKPKGQRAPRVHWESGLCTHRLPNDSVHCWDLLREAVSQLLPLPLPALQSVLVHSTVASSGSALLCPAQGGQDRSRRPKSDV